MLVDLAVSHAHIRSSSLTDVAGRAAALGLDGVALLESNRWPVELKARIAAEPELPVRLFAGAQVETDRGWLAVFVADPSVLGTLDEFLPGQRPWHVRDVIDRVRAVGGAVVSLRPYDTSVPNPCGDVVYTLEGLAAVQTVDSVHVPGLSAAAVEAADTLGLPGIGASGAQTLDQIGRSATLFDRPLRSEAELAAALTRGACWAVDFRSPPSGLSSRAEHAGPVRRSFDGDSSRETGSRPPSEGERSGRPPGGGGGGRRRRRR